MASPSIQTSFAAGELAPSLLGHVDYNRYSIGCSTLRNMFVSYRGGAYSRAGTMFVGYSKQTERSNGYGPRLITFQFSLNQGICLEFGHLYMRVVVGGAFVTETAQAIVSITNANPAVVTVTGHGYSDGDWVYFPDADGMSQLTGNTYIINVTGADTFELLTPLSQSVDSTNYGVYTAGGTVARVYTLVTPYREEDLEFLKFTQSADVMSLTLRNQDTSVEYVPQELTRLADDNWTIAPLSTAATIAPPGSPAGSASDAGTTDYQYVITAVDATTGEESIASAIIDIASSAFIASTPGSLILSWAAVANAAYYNIYRAPTAYNATVPPGSLFYYVGTAYGLGFVDSNITPDTSQVPPLHNNPFTLGVILAVTVLTPGSNLTGVTPTIHTSTGSGAVLIPVLDGAAGSQTLVAVIVSAGGQGYSGADTITFADAAGVAASGTVNWTGPGNPTNGSTVTPNGVVWTFVSGAPGANQVQIQGTVAATITTLRIALNASVDPLLSVATYTSSGPILTVTYDTVGTVGNAYTLAASAGVPSGGTLTGGVGGTAPTGTLVLSPSSGIYPSVVAYFQQRRVYANTANQPDTYFMSQPGAFTNFDSRVPTIDSDAIIGTPWSVTVDGIQFMLPMPGGLVVLTGAAAYQLTGAGGGGTTAAPVTPSSQSALPQAYNGCNPRIGPARIDYDIYYLQAKGSVIRSLSYNFFINSFTGTDVTYLSSHLFTDFVIKGMAWCEEPFKIMWTPRDDGVLLSLTSLKSQEVMGWARHDTQGLFTNSTSVTEPPVDALYVATQRFVPGFQPYFIERFDNRLWRTIEDAWCVDAGVRLDQGTPAASLTFSLAAGLGSIPAVTVTDTGNTSYGAATTATVVDLDKIGSGATLSVTVVAGVITAITPLTVGAGYLRPKINIIDPSNSGRGATAVATLNNSSTCIASAAVFNSGMIGWTIRAGGGIAVITAYISTTNVTVAMTSPVTRTLPNSGGQTYPFRAGDWTLTEPSSTFSGLNHLIGLTVTGLADGVVIDPQVVDANGEITLPHAATAVTVGLGFQCQLQTLYLDSSNPTDQGRRKKIGAATVRIEASRGFSTGSNQPDGSAQSPMRVETPWTNLQTPPETGPNLAQIPYGTAFIANTNNIRAIPLFTGDVHVKISSGSGEKEGQVAVQQDAPSPLQVLAVIPETTIGDDPDKKKGQ